MRKELSSLGEAINISALEDWESKVLEFLADLKAGVDELITVAPQVSEEQHEVFLVKKRVVDTLVERIQIDRERNLQVQIRLNLLEIIGKDAQDESIAAVPFSRGRNLYPYSRFMPRWAAIDRIVVFYSAGFGGSFIHQEMEIAN